MTDESETWYMYVAFGLWAFEHYQDCSNDDLGLTLIYVTARSNMGKYANTLDFMESYEGFGLKIGN